jgi:hypothetical protein
VILGRELPSWKQLMNRKKQPTEKPFMEDENSFLFAESCMSIHAILQAIRGSKMVSANLVDESQQVAGKIQPRIPTVSLFGFRIISVTRPSSVSESHG